MIGARTSEIQEVCQGCQEKAAEIERLRTDIAAARSHCDEGRQHMAASPMVWAALSICGIGLLFAIFAIVHHG